MVWPEELVVYRCKFASSSESSLKELQSRHLIVLLVLHYQLVSQILSFVLPSLLMTGPNWFFDDGEMGNTLSLQDRPTLSHFLLPFSYLSLLFAGISYVASSSMAPLPPSLK